MLDAAYAAIPKIRLKAKQEEKKTETIIKIEKEVSHMTAEQQHYFIGAKGDNKKYQTYNTYESDIILVKPTVDASDKEIFARNGFIGAGENIKQLIYAKERMKVQDTAFMPASFG